LDLYYNQLSQKFKEYSAKIRIYHNLIFFIFILDNIEILFITYIFAYNERKLLIVSFIGMIAFETVTKALSINSNEIFYCGV